MRLTITTARGIVAITFVLVLSPTLAAQPRQPIARIGGEAIYEEDLAPAIEGQLLHLKNQEYELKTKALDQLLSERVLEAEARDKGTTVQALMQQAERDLPPWHIKELEGYYLAQKDRFNQPFEAVSQEVEKAYILAKRQQARKEYIESLRRKAGVAILLKRPKPELAIDPARVRGNPDAPITITEFVDFQCPYCRSVQPVLNQVMEKYKGKVRLGFRDFPLRSIHQQAQEAAEASRCAGEQGRFWQYNDLLFANQTGLSSGAYREFASSAGLDGGRFQTCVGSGRFKPLIESDLQTAVASGVSATPSFLINDVLLSGWQSVAAFEKVIEAQLSALASRKPAP